MISIDEGLVTQLNGAADVIALRQARMYPTKLPIDAKLPAQTYRKVSGVRDHTHTGQATLANPRFQLTSWATTATQAKALAKATRLALSGVQNGLGELRASVQLVNEMDIVEPDSETFGVAQDYMIWHQEDV